MTNPLLEEIVATAGMVIREDFNQPVELIDPDGKLYTQSAENPENKIMGLVQWEDRDVDVDTGMETIVSRPVVSLFMSDLERRPEARMENGRYWIVRVPESPLSDGLVSYTLAGPPKIFNTFNYITLKLQSISQI